MRFGKRSKYMSGYIALVQESRIGLVDDDGAGHVFILSWSSLAEPQQLADLQRRQARVRIRYTQADDLVALVARAIEVEPPPP